MRKSKINNLEMRKSPLLAQNEVRDDIFSGSLAVCLFASASRRGGRKGGLGGIPPALQILGEISSNFFERTPLVKKTGFTPVFL